MGVKQFTYEDLTKALDATSENSYKSGYRDGLLAGFNAAKKCIVELEKAINAKEEEKKLNAILDELEEEIWK